jgi:hypothetical protein
MHDAIDTTFSPLQNHLLAALPEEVQTRIFPFVELEKLELGQVMYEAGDKLAYVHFPVDAIVFLLYVMRIGPELKEANDDAWEDLKAGMDSAWNSLSKAVKSVRSKFK